MNGICYLTKRVFSIHNYHLLFIFLFLLHIKEGHTLETFSVAGIDAVCVWLATHMDTGISEYEWRIPASFSCIRDHAATWFMVWNIA